MNATAPDPEAPDPAAGRRRGRRVVVTLVAGLLAAAPAAAQERVAFSGDDGHVLHGRLWSGESGAAAVLLMHQCDGDQSGLGGLAGRVAARGLHVLTYDQRGYGESAGGDYDLEAERERDFWPRVRSLMPADARAAARFLRQTPGVDGDRLGLLGASCSGGRVTTLALDAEIGPAVHAAVYLSTRQSAAGVARLEPRDASLATFWIAAEGDRRAAEAARLGGERSLHPASRQRIFPGHAHGTPLLDEQAGLADEIADWFRDRLERPQERTR